MAILADHMLCSDMQIPRLFLPSYCRSSGVIDVGYCVWLYIISGDLNSGPHAKCSKHLNHRASFSPNSFTSNTNSVQNKETTNRTQNFVK